MYTLFIIAASAFLVSSTSLNVNNADLTTTAKPVTCPPKSFHAYASQQCFQVFNNSLYFMDAELACNQFGGHLASIHNAFDNMLITGHARAALGTNMTFFNGATNLQSGSQSYTWIDQTNMDYNDYSYPLYNTQIDNCLQINTNDGKWYTADCYTPAPYVCEIAPM